jgi:hypothetical protein
VVLAVYTTVYNLATQRHPFNMSEELHDVCTDMLRVMVRQYLLDFESRPSLSQLAEGWRRVEVVSDDNKRGAKAGVLHVQRRIMVLKRFIPNGRDGGYPTGGASEAMICQLMWRLVTCRGRSG